MTSAPSKRHRVKRAQHWAGSVRDALLRAFDALLPAECLGCRSVHLPPEHSSPVCPDCLMRLREIPWPRCSRCHAPRGTGAGDLPCLDCQDWPAVLERARSAVVHEDPATRMVAALKYESWPIVATVMARAMEPLVSELPPGPIVPVPTTPSRIRRRGYNQAEILARAVASRTGRHVRTLLARRPLSASQVALQRWQRISNVYEAFFVPPPHGRVLREGHVILLDDVLTTGSTATAAAEALGSSGVSSVSVITFARALPYERRRVHT